MKNHRSILGSQSEPALLSSLLLAPHGCCGSAICPLNRPSRMKENSLRVFGREHLPFNLPWINHEPCHWQFSRASFPLVALSLTSWLSFGSNSEWNKLPVLQTPWGWTLESHCEWRGETPVRFGGGNQFVPGKSTFCKKEYIKPFYIHMRLGMTLSDSASKP